MRLTKTNVIMSSRDCRGVAEPQGFGAGVRWGRGKGWNFCTPAKPLPSAGVQGYV